MTKKLLLFFLCAQAALFAQTAPNLIVTDLEGTTHNLYNYLDAGKTVILDFFIINCTSCQDGAPYLDEFWVDYGPEGSDDIQVISIEVSSSSNEQVAAIGVEWGIENPVVNLSETPSAFAPFIQSYPTYLVICPNKSMTSLIDFNYPETILSWEQSLNICDFGTDFTDANILANDITHCQKNMHANLVVGNVGTRLINSLTIDVFVDSNYFSSIVWNHPLPPNSNTNNSLFPIEFDNSEINADYIEFKVLTQDDVNPLNNQVGHNLTDGLITTNTEFTLQIKMDNYPIDLFWLLSNSTDAIILEGIGADYNPFEEIEFPLLLDSNDCYTFTLIDEVGDGFCCNFGEGYFNLFSNEDTLIANPDFDSFFSESFYIGTEIGIDENTQNIKKIINKLYFNIMGQAILYPTKNGIYLQQTIFEDGSFYSEKMILTNTNL